MRKLGLAAFMLAMVFGGFYLWSNNGQAQLTNSTNSTVVDPALKGYQVATFAGGCFWCVEAGFEKVPGVKTAISGYSGGKEKNPTYQQVGYGLTSHTESVQVYYDNKIISYEGLLAAFWRMMDPTDNGGQFKDRGAQYRPAIFYHNDMEKKLAEKSQGELARSGPFKKPVKVEITKFTNFYPAEDYHQDYYKKNPVRYKLYTYGSGRADFVKNSWGDKLAVDYSKYRPSAHSSSKSASSSSKSSNPVTSRFTKPSKTEIKKRLTPLQFKVTQHEGTEAPYKNEFWNEKRQGIYVDIVSGEPLFSSTDKYKSGTGWPSFTRPIRNASIVKKIDKKLFSTRVEVRSEVADSHLGHVFNDGPAPTGKRYCINSASLRFVPADKLVEKGYGDYADIFVAKQ